MKLSVVIVNYNVKNYVEQCLLSLHKALEGIEAEVLLVDNHSVDGSVEYLREHFDWVRIVASRHNLGFARANNLAIRMCFCSIPTPSWQSPHCVRLWRGWMVMQIPVPWVFAC